MAFKNTREMWGSVSKTFHWVIVVLVLFMLTLGISFGWMDQESTKLFWMTIHKSTGIVVLVLVLCRLLWRFVNVSPQLSSTVSKTEVVLSRITHALFYVALIAMPLSGLLASATKGRSVNFFWWFEFYIPFPQSKALHEFFEGTHTFLAWLIVALIALHVLGALKHHFIDKNKVLLRMLPHKIKR